VGIRTDQAGRGFDLIVMIASLGGIQSAATVLRGLPGDFPCPVVLFQHGRMTDRRELLADVLRRQTKLPVRTAEHGAIVSGPGVTVIPHGWHASLDSDFRLALAPAEREAGGDALLASAAQVAGPRLLGVVLSGLLRDGTNGVRAIKRHGGRVLVEDPSTARAGAMPANALATGCVDFALPSARLASALIALALAPGGAELFAVPTPAWASLGA
jgi:two-component system, chemotaxis family, protein-glutamate methylesterase/glutaminase